jgi:hypothetical protein
VTINDGAGEQRFCEHLFVGDGKGGFTDATAARWPAADNPRCDDNMIVFLDYDSDGDADFLIGSLDGHDRLLVNDGRGHFRAGAPVFAGDPTRGTLGIAIADLDGDHKLDVVHAQGEVATASADKVFFGKSLAPDTAAPWIGALDVRVEANDDVAVRVRIHDRRSPSRPTDWQRVVLQVEHEGAKTEHPLTWYGEYLWRARFASKASTAAAQLRVVATDAAGNTATSPPVPLPAR